MEENKGYFEVIRSEFCSEEELQEDIINSLERYKLDGFNIEVIDVIKTVLTPEEYRGYLKGNVIKYNIIACEKNGIFDYLKANKYLS